MKRYVIGLGLWLALCAAGVGIVRAEPALSACVQAASPPNTATFGWLFRKCK